MTAPRATPAPLSLLAATSHILRKDLLLEWRSRTRLNATLFFAAMALLLFSFALGPEQALLARHAGGFLWLAILLSSVLSLTESFRVESENSALEGLCLLGVDARAVFLGKALANTFLLLLLGGLLAPLAAALYGVSASATWPYAGLVLLFGCAAISAPGTLYAAIVSRSRARDVLLPLLLFPVLVPALVAAVKATELALNGDPHGELGLWLVLLLLFNLVYWSFCTLLFGRVIEE